jgi:hypothetical protein
MDHSLEIELGCDERHRISATHTPATLVDSSFRHPQGSVAGVAPHRLDRLLSQARGGFLMVRFASAFPRMLGRGTASVLLVVLALIAGSPAASGRAMNGVARAASSGQVDVSRTRARPTIARAVNTAAPVARSNTAAPDARRSLATTAGGTIQFGVPTTFTVSTGGETAWMTFSGSVGMRVSMTTSMSGTGTWTAKILDPNGNLVASCSTNCNLGSNFIDTKTLSVAGLHTVQLTANVAGNATITLYNVPDDLALSTTPLSGNGAAVPITITTPGQNAVITFQGREGERLSWSHSDAISLYNTWLRKADTPNTPLVSCGTYCNGGSAFLEPFTLHVSPVPASDATYNVVFDPSYTWTGSKTIKLYDVPDDLAVSLIPTSATTSVSLPIDTPGQNAQITFPGYAGQVLSWTQTSTVPVYTTGLWLGVPPNTSLITSCGYSCNGYTGTLNPRSLTSSGTYRVVFNPSYSYKGSHTIALKLSPGLAVQITGLPYVGEVLTAVLGSATPPGDSYAYQWLRCDSSGGVCVELTGAIAMSYLVTDAESGKTLRVRVTAANGSGSTSILSEPSSVILPLIARWAPELRYAAVENYRADSPAEMTDNYNDYYTNKLQAGDESVIAAASPARLDPPNNQVPQLSLDFLDTTYHGTVFLADAADHIDELDNTGSVPSVAQPIDSQRMHGLPQYANRAYAQMWSDTATGEKIFQYWLFSYYNSKADPTIGVGEHEGDWEMVQVRVGANGAPIDATYAQHREAERCDWSRVEKSANDHPVVYVAVDSHASYFTPDNHDYLGGVETDWAPGDDPIRVVPSVVDISSNPGWVRWPGKWGGSGASPQGPHFQGDKSSQPFTWQADANSCSAPIRARALATAGRGRVLRTRVLPPLPDIKAKIEGKRVVVAYSFRTFPSGRDRRPWLLITAVKPAGNRYGPVTKHTLIRRREGRFSQPLGAGHGPFHLLVAVRAKSGVSNGTLKIPLR